MRGLTYAQVNPAMHLISGQLGVGCTYCHIWEEWEREDKPTKQVARRMMILAALPEMTLGAAGTASTSTEFCHLETPYLTQGKGYAAYTIPVIDVLVAGTFQSIPGNALTAAINIPSAVIAQSLGRPLSGNAPNASINVIPATGLVNNFPVPVLGASAVTNSALYGERINQIDLRFGKIFRLQQRRLTLNFDLYNLLNGDTVTATNNNYAALWRPTGILQARFIKLGLQLEF